MPGKIRARLFSIKTKTLRFIKGVRRNLPFCFYLVRKVARTIHIKQLDNMRLGKTKDTGRALLDEALNASTIGILGTQSFVDFYTEILLTYGINSIAPLESDLRKLETASCLKVVIVEANAIEAESVEYLLTWSGVGKNLIFIKPTQMIANRLKISLSARPTRALQLVGSDLFPEDFPVAELPLLKPQHVLAINGEIDAVICDAESHAVIAGCAYGDGEIVCYGYDPREEVIAWRQGLNMPDWSKFKNGSTPRSKFFFSDNSDLRRMWYPAADLQVKLFGRIVERLIGTPIPLLWYFPNPSLTGIILTGDDDWATADQFSQQVSVVEQSKAKITLFLIKDSSFNAGSFSNAVTSGTVDLGMHPDVLFTKCPFYGLCSHPFRFYRKTAGNFQLELSDHVRDFIHRYDLQPLSLRNHHHYQKGYSELQSACSNLGVKIHFNFYSEDGTYLNGSGLPMKDVDEQGELIDVYSMLTLLAEDYVNNGKESDLIIITKDRIQQAKKYFHHPVVLNMHPHNYKRRYRAWMHDVIDFVNSHQIPFFTVREWLSFWEKRSQCRISNLNFSEGILSFCLLSSANIERLTLVLPSQSFNNVLDVQISPKLDVHISENHYEGRRHTAITVKQINSATNYHIKLR